MIEISIGPTEMAVGPVEQWFSNGVCGPFGVPEALDCQWSRSIKQFCYNDATKINWPIHVHWVSRLDYHLCQSFKVCLCTFSFLHLVFCHCSHPIFPPSLPSDRESFITTADPEGAPETSLVENHCCIYYRPFQTRATGRYHFQRPCVWRELCSISEATNALVLGWIVDCDL